MGKWAPAEDFGRFELKYTCCGSRGAKVKESLQPESRKNYTEENVL